MMAQQVDCSGYSKYNLAVENYSKVMVIYGIRGMRLAWDIASSAKEFDYYLWLNDDGVV
jgi:hypothetical protein